MTRAERIAVWRARIRRAQEQRKRFFEGTGTEGLADWVPGCDFGIKAYRGSTKPTWWCEEDIWCEVNKTKAAVRAALPALLYTNPEFKVWPTAMDDPATAYARSQAKALWLNHTYRETSGNTHVRVAIQNAFFSLGVVKGGYLCHFEDDVDRGVWKKDEAGNYVIGPDGDPELERGKYLTDEDGEKIRDEYGVPILHPGKLQKEKWFIEAVDPRMMLFDVASGVDFMQHRWVIEEWLRPLEQVKNDPRFSPAVRKRLTASESVNGPASQRKSPFGNPNTNDAQHEAVESDEAMLRGYDIYDFETGEYLVLPECGVETGDNEEFMLVDDQPPGMEHGPYRFLKFTEDVGTEWYPVPDAIDMALAQQRYSLLESQMAIHREHTKTRYKVLEGTFQGEGIDPEEEMAKAAHGPDGTFLRVTNMGGIEPLNKAPLDNSFFQAVGNIAADFNEVAGMPGETRGVADADTATQASILATSAELRANDRRDNQVQTFLSDIGRMLLMSGQANAELDTITMEKIQAAVGEIPFRAVVLSPEELQGEFEVEIAVGSQMAKNDPRTLQMLAALLAQIGQNPVIGLMPGLVRRYLDGLGIDQNLADEVFNASLQFLQSQMQPAQPETAAASPGQQLQAMLTGGVGSAAGGAATGAPQNQYQ